MNFTLNILGTASALPMVNRYPSAQVLDVHGRLFMIDCGEGAQMQMRRSSLSFLKIESIFISHIHGDHLFGLPGLLSTMSMLGRQTPLKIFAPANFGPVLDFFIAHFGEGMRFEAVHVPLEMSVPQLIHQTRTLEVYAFPLRHRIETYGYLFREKEPMLNVRKDKIAQYGLSLAEIGALKRGEDVVREGLTIANSEAAYRPWKPRSYAYCSDTVPFPELAGWVKGVDLLYHEATYPVEMTDRAAANFHSTTLQAAECAKAAGVGRLLVGHYSSKYPDNAFFIDEVRSVFPNADLTHDGDRFDIPLNRIRT